MQPPRKAQDEDRPIGFSSYSNSAYQRDQSSKGDAHSHEQTLPDGRLESGVKRQEYPYGSVAPDGFAQPSRDPGPLSIGTGVWYNRKSGLSQHL